MENEILRVLVLALLSAAAFRVMRIMVTFWGTCLIFVVVVLGTVARISGFSIFRLIRLIRDELLIIVGTSSSETVLPGLLAKLEAASSPSGRASSTRSASTRP